MCLPINGQQEYAGCKKRIPCAPLGLRSSNWRPTARWCLLPRCTPRGSSRGRGAGAHLHFLATVLRQQHIGANLQRHRDETTILKIASARRRLSCSGVRERAACAALGTKGRADGRGGTLSRAPAPTATTVPSFCLDWNCAAHGTMVIGWRRDALHTSRRVRGARCVPPPPPRPCAAERVQSSQRHLLRDEDAGRRLRLGCRARHQDTVQQRTEADRRRRGERTGGYALHGWKL